MTEQDLNAKPAEWVLRMMAIGEADNDETMDKIEQMKATRTKNKR